MDPTDCLAPLKDSSLDSEPDCHLLRGRGMLRGGSPLCSSDTKKEYTCSSGRAVLLVVLCLAVTAVGGRELSFSIRDKPSTGPTASSLSFENCTSEIH